MDTPAAPIPSISPLPAVEPEASTPSESPNRRWFLWLIGGIALLALGIALGLFGVKFFNQSQSQPQLTPTPSPTQFQFPTPIPTTDLTADWKTYKLKTLNLEFKLPLVFNSYGEMEEKVESGEKGTLFCLTFPQNTSIRFIRPIFAGGAGCFVRHFGMGSLSTDYEAGRGGVFADLLGFSIENGKYYARQNLDRKFEIPSELVKPINNPNGIQMIKVTGKNSTTGEWQGPIGGTPGEGKIGALLNTNDKVYPGIAVEMELNNVLTENLFDQILSTFHFLK